MSVQFILGRSGTGKTRYCIDAIAADLLTGPQGPALILLVPEQATFQAERAVLSHPKIAGFSRLHVVSFDRLRCLLAGRGSARRRLSEAGRQMVVHRILRDLAPQLQVFGPSALQPGFSRQMGQTLAELHQCAHAAQDIDALIGRLGQDGQGRVTALKLGDIKRVLQEYGRAVEGRFIDPDIELSAARKAMAKAGWLRDSRLWVDGFAGFTGAELLILQELLRLVSAAWIALCLDPDELDLSHGGPCPDDPTRPFYPTEQTYSLLVRGIKDAGMTLGPPIVLEEPRRFQNCPALAHLEKGLFSPVQPPAFTVPHSEGAIRIWVADNPRAEAQAVARQIRRLVQDKGLRYRDIAVICPDLDQYQHYLRAYLADLEIPFFIDSPRPLRHHPLVVLIASALQAVASGFQTRDIIVYLKTGLVPIDADRIDLLENYCLAFGIRGSDWTGDGPWTFDDPAQPAFDQDRVNAVRREAVRALLWLKRQLDAEQGLSAEAFAQAVLGLLDRLKASATLQSWIDRANQAGEPGLADEYAQAEAWVGDILDEFVEVFDGQTAGAAQWVSVIGSALSQACLALIPPTLDQVLVGSVERSRHPDLKAVFLLGTTQRQFPVPLSQAGLLTDDDRHWARAGGLSLAGGTSEALAARRYLAYIAFTRASELLVLSLPKVDERGAPVTRSPFVDDLQRLFEGIADEQVDPEPARIEEVVNRMDLADVLCARAGTDGLYAGLVEEVCQDPQLESVGRSARAALGYRNQAVLDPDVARLLMGNDLAGSVTRLATFAACPYRHFARYILDLQPRQEFKLEPLDVGDFYHRVLDGLVKTTLSARQDLGQLDDETLRRQVGQVIRSTIEADSFLSNFARHSRFNEYILGQASSTIEDCCLDLAAMVRAGAFRPVLSEVGFGGPQDPLGDFRMALSGGRGLTLRGKIDRIDVAETAGEQVAMVVDYKRRKDQATFDWSEFLDGLDLQLPIYLLALDNARRQGLFQAEAAGGFFMQIEADISRAPLGDVPAEADRFHRKAYGVFDGRYAGLLDPQAQRDSRFYNFYAGKDGQPYGQYHNRGALKPEDFAAVLRYAQGKITDLAGQVLSGVIAVHPCWLKGQAACRRCDYQSVCRFDGQIQEYRYPDPVGKTEALERIGGQT